MGAGDGAAEQAQRAAERVARLRSELARAENDERAWTAGAAGEVRVAERLAELESRGWLILHDVHWPGRAKANLDHVAVGPGGILVLDAKNWTGAVEIRDGELHQNGYPRARATSSALEQAAALAALLEPRHRTLVQAWVCMVGHPGFQGAARNGVRIEGIDTLVAAVADLNEVLDTHSISAIHAYLRDQLDGAVTPHLLTTAGLDGTRAASQTLQNRRAAARQGVPFPQQSVPPRSVPPRTGHGFHRPARSLVRQHPKPPALLWFLIQLVFLMLTLVMLFEVTAKWTAPVPDGPAPAPATALSEPGGQRNVGAIS